MTSPIFCPIDILKILTEAKAALISEFFFFHNTNSIPVSCRCVNNHHVCGDIFQEAEQQLWVTAGNGSSESGDALR